MTVSRWKNTYLSYAEPATAYPDENCGAKEDLHQLSMERRRDPHEYIFVYETCKYNT